MMLREWVKDTREALERAGQGERIDRRSLAERRDEAERSDLEQAAELSRKPNVHLGPQAYRAGDLEREGRGERSGVLAAGRPGGAGQSGASAGAGRPHRADRGSRRGSRGSIGSFRRSRGRLVKRSFFETTWRRRWRHEISGLNWRNRPAATTVQPEHGPQPQLALVYRIQQAPGHFMDNEDTRVPTVHIRERRAYHRRHAAGTLGRPHGQYRPDSSWRTLGGVSRRTRNQPIPLGESDRHTSATHQ